MLPRLPTSTIRRVIYPAYRSLRRDRVLETAQALEKSQWLPPDQLEILRWARLAEFLKAATAEVPYYREVFRQAGMRAQDVRTRDDFLKVPLLTKQQVRAAGRSMITENKTRKGLASSTSGSTGEPMYFYCDLASGSIRRATALLGYKWAGADIADRIAYIWGFHLGAPLGERIASGVKNYFLNKIYMSSFNMTEEAMGRYARTLAAYKPSVIDGYPSAVSLFAEFCVRHGLSDIRPRAVVTSGETIAPHQADVVRRAFKCPVFDRYGSREFSITAHDCDRHEGLHVINDHLFLEVLDRTGRPAASGETGEIVITDLANLYMPFVRYCTGDLAVATARRCSCGRGSPLLERIEGRTFDVVVTTDGRSAGGFFWTHLSRSVPGISRFQIEQHDPGGVTFRVVRGPEWKDDYRHELMRRIKENLGESFKVDFQTVDEIPLTPAGKFRFIWSTVDRPAGLP